MSSLSNAEREKWSNRDSPKNHAKPIDTHPKPNRSWEKREKFHSMLPEEKLVILRARGGAVGDEVVLLECGGVGVRPRKISPIALVRKQDLLQMGFVHPKPWVLH